jgi:hypothetical protein
MLRVPELVAVGVRVSTMLRNINSFGAGMVYWMPMLETVPAEGRLATHNTVRGNSIPICAGV